MACQRHLSARRTGLRRAERPGGPGPRPFRPAAALPCRSRTPLMTTRNLPVNGSRIWDDLMALAAITDPDQPWTRRAFSRRFLEGRAWLKARMEEAGLVTRLDSGGNLIGRRDGRVPGKGTIVVGSHTDTVPSGGRFDGPAGV